MKGAIGGNTSTIIDVSRQRKAYFKKGKAHCKKCVYLAFGYYCDKMNKSAIHVDKPKHCYFYIEKTKPNAIKLKKEMDMKNATRNIGKRKKPNKK